MRMSLRDDQVRDSTPGRRFAEKRESLFSFPGAAATVVGARRWRCAEGCGAVTGATSTDSLAVNGETVVEERCRGASVSGEGVEGAL